MRNISWNTKKTATGFEFSVYEIASSTTPNAQGSYAELITLKTGSAHSRAVAKSTAQKWVRYLKSVH